VASTYATLLGAGCMVFAVSRRFAVQAHFFNRAQACNVRVGRWLFADVHKPAGHLGELELLELHLARLLALANRAPTVAVARGGGV
jgi:hypothetical protein